MSELNIEDLKELPEYTRVREEFEIATKLRAAFHVGSAMLNVDELLREARRAPVSTPQQSAPEAVQSVVACARRVLSKFGADSDWSEWKDLADALREFDSAGQDQQSAQRASVDTEDAFAWAVFADNGNVIIWSKRRDVVEPVAAEYGKPIVPIIAHINAWGSAGSGATSDVVRDTTWRNLLEAVVREFPRNMGRGHSGNAPGHCHSRPGIWDDDNGALAGKPCAWCIAWNGASQALAAAAPSPAPQGEQA